MLIIWRYIGVLILLEIMRLKILKKYILYCTYYNVWASSGRFRVAFRHYIMT